MDTGRYQGWQCLSILQRLMALFDTVLSTNTSANSARPVRLAIPAEVQSVFHAVAMNENRALFDVESISRSEAGLAEDRTSSSRVERGFVGSHANIGGGYDTAPGRGADNRSDLSDIALIWMVQQAQRAGVEMRTLPEDLRIVSRPVVIDETRSLGWTVAGQRWGSRDVGFHGDRPVEPQPDATAGPDTQNGRPFDRRPERQQSQLEFAGGMNQDLANSHINPRRLRWYQVTETAVGDVHLCGYLAWLARHYEMTVDLALNGCPQPQPQP